MSYCISENVDFTEFLKEISVKVAINQSMEFIVKLSNEINSRATSKIMQIFLYINITRVGKNLQRETKTT